MKFLTNLNLTQNELQNVVLHLVATEPSSPKKGQWICNTATNKCGYFDGTKWVYVGDGVNSVDVETGETVIYVNNTDNKNPKLKFKIAATQGTGVTLTEEADGLKTVVQDGTLTQKGIVQLDSTPSATVEDKAATPKGANVTVTKATTVATATNYAEYDVKQGGLEVAANHLIEIPKVEIVKQATAEEGYAATYYLTQGGVQSGAKINIDKDRVVKFAKTQVVKAYATGVAYAAYDVIDNDGNTYIVTKAITAADNTSFAAVSTKLYEDKYAVDTKLIELVIIKSDGTTEEDEAYLLIDVTDKEYTGTENQIAISSDGKISIDNTITEKTELKVYPMTVSNAGLVTATGTALKTVKRDATTISTGNTSATYDLTNKEFITASAYDASGEKVEVEQKISATSVVFTIAQAYTENITCVVIYRDDVVEA